MSESPERASNPNAGRRRLFARLVCLLAAISLLWPSSYWRMVIVPALSPFVALCSLIATRTIGAITVLGLVVGLVMLFLPRRFFCRWICPMGLCLTGCDRVGRKLGRTTIRSIAIGQWIFLSTVAGAMVGFPLFLWLDPLAIFAGAFHLVGPASTHCWLAFGMPTLLLIAVLWPNLWCGSLCPLGGFQELLYTLRNRKKLAQTDVPLRRVLLGAAAGAAAATVVRFTHASDAPPLRPPGAVDELTLGGLCTRCGNCMRACPTCIIGADIGQGGVSTLLTPVLSFEKNHCREDCVACTTVCPSGALTRLSLAKKPKIRIGEPIFDMELCLLSQPTECSACSMACPYNAIRYEFCEETYKLAPQVDASKCNGCGACVVACPVGPHRAVVVTSRKQGEA